jgi:hypothetical protein
MIARASSKRPKGPPPVSTPLSYIERLDLKTMRAVLRTPLGSRERQKFWDQHSRAADAARAQLPIEVEALSTRVHEVDGLKLLGAAHALDSMRRSSLPGDANFGSDAMLELLAGVVATVPEATLVPNIDVPFNPQLLYDVDAKLRKIANMESQVRFMAALENSAGGDDSGVIGLLRNTPLTGCRGSILISAELPKRSSLRLMHWRDRR